MLGGSSGQRRRGTAWIAVNCPKNLPNLPSSPGVPGKDLLDDAGRNAFWIRFRNMAERRWLGTNGAAAQADEVAGIERLKRMTAEVMPKPTEEMMQAGWLQGTQKRIKRLDSRITKVAAGNRADAI